MSRAKVSRATTASRNCFVLIIIFMTCLKRLYFHLASFFDIIIFIENLNNYFVQLFWLKYVYRFLFSVGTIFYK